MWGKLTRISVPFNSAPVKAKKAIKEAGTIEIPASFTILR